MTDAQVLVLQGRKEGRKEGQIEMLLEQLGAKFGPLSAGLADAVRALPQRRLKEVAREVLTARSLADLGLES